MTMAQGIIKTISMVVPQGASVNSATQLVAFIKNEIPDIEILLRMELIDEITMDNQFVKYEYDSDFKVTSTRYKNVTGSVSEFAWNSSTISVSVKGGSTYEVKYIPNQYIA